MAFLCFAFKTVHRSKRHVNTTGELVHIGLTLTEQSRRKLLLSSFFTKFLGATEVLCNTTPSFVCGSRNFHLCTFPSLFFFFLIMLSSYLCNSYAFRDFLNALPNLTEVLCSHTESPYKRLLKTVRIISFRHKDNSAIKLLQYHSCNVNQFLPFPEGREKRNFFFPL